MIARFVFVGAVFAAGLCAYSPAFAQTVTLRTLAGAWTVEEPTADRLGCVVHGAATAVATARNLIVELEVLETCPDGDARAHERCVGPLVQSTLRLQCVVTVGGDIYAPDQFVLHVESTDFMQGRLLDLPLWNDPVQWTRSAGVPIS